MSLLVTPLVQMVYPLRRLRERYAGLTAPGMQVADHAPPERRAAER